MEKKAQIKLLVSLSAILLLVLLFVFAQSNDPSENTIEAAEEFPTNIAENISEENATVPLATITGEAIEETIQKDQKSLKQELAEIIEEKRHKLNDETASELETLSLEDDQKFIIKHKASFDKGKLNKFEKEKHIPNFNLIRIDGKVKDIGDILLDEDIEY